MKIKKYIPKALVLLVLISPAECNGNKKSSPDSTSPQPETPAPSTLEAGDPNFAPFQQDQPYYAQRLPVAKAANSPKTIDDLYSMTHEELVRVPASQLVPALINLRQLYKEGKATLDRVKAFNTALCEELPRLVNHCTSLNFIVPNPTNSVCSAKEDAKNPVFKAELRNTQGVKFRIITTSKDIEYISDEIGEGVTEITFQKKDGLVEAKSPRFRDLTGITLQPVTANSTIVNGYIKELRDISSLSLNNLLFRILVDQNAIDDFKYLINTTDPGTQYFKLSSYNAKTRNISVSPETMLDLSTFNQCYLTLDQMATIRTSIEKSLMNQP